MAQQSAGSEDSTETPPSRRVAPRLAVFARDKTLVHLARFHPVGLASALVFFMASMTPSLLPRAWFLQAVATGISVVTGYGVGCVIAWVVRKAGVHPQWRVRTKHIGWWALAGWAAIVVPLYLYLGAETQQTVRDLVGVPRAERALYLPILLVSLVIAWLLLMLGRGLRRSTNATTRFIDRFVPLPVARLTALGLVIVLAIFVINGAIIKGIVNLAESTAEVADGGTAEGVEQPQATERSGSSSSDQGWDTLGREGRTFVAGGPTAEDITAVTGEPGPTPIRVYAGRESAETLSGIADLVVAELERTNAFDRDVLAVATTTGSGWVNGNIASSLEYLMNGNTAIASMQYSYLPSPIAFIVDRETPKLAGQALFDAVYDAWERRPEDERPKLIAFGESLGSFGGQSDFGSAADMAARTDGALWSGTPNFAEPWGSFTERRDVGSPEWQPLYQDGRHIRFAAQPADTDLDAPWESARIVYWQHANDPIVWWSPDLLLNQPDWLREPLGPGLDPDMRWLPFVTFWQVTMDMALSTDVPYGFGHSYGPESVYMWAEILQPEGWTTAQSDQIFETLSG